MSSAELAKLLAHSIQSWIFAKRSITNSGDMLIVYHFNKPLKKTPTYTIQWPDIKIPLPIGYG